MEHLLTLKSSLPVMRRVIKRKEEAEGIFTLFIEGSIDFSPGQFVFIWLPGVEEKPFTISYINSGSENYFGVTVQVVGNFTERLSRVKAGDLIGVRGPLGRGFSTSSKGPFLIVNGGVGAASTAILAEELINRGEDVDIIIGARNKRLLIYTERFKAEICTDDGSRGRKGFVTEIADEMMGKKHYSRVYTCGPEKMMDALLRITEKHGVELEASVERYMSCGFGICGKCMLNDRLVCLDGPVFNSKQLNELADFGMFRLDKTGARIRI